MLRSWTDRICVYLHPEEVVLVRVTGIFNRRVIRKQVITYIVPDETHWGGAIKALRIALQQDEWQRARVSVVLSGNFVRYRVVPWDDRLTTDEREALLRHQMLEIYGEEMRASTLTIADAGFGKQSLACAVDAHLMAALNDVCMPIAVRLVSIKPFLMLMFNQWRKEIGNQGAWLVVAEKSRLTIALISKGEWVGVHSQASTVGWEENLSLLLGREAMRLGVDATEYPTYFFWPDKPDYKPVLAGCPVVVLRLPMHAGYSLFREEELWLLFAASRASVAG